MSTGLAFILGIVLAGVILQGVEPLARIAQRRMWKRIREKDRIDLLRLRRTIDNLVVEKRFTPAEASYLLTRAEIPPDVLTPEEKVEAMFEFAELTEQTPEEAEAELRAAGVDVDAFLARVRERIAAVKRSAS